MTRSLREALAGGPAGGIATRGRERVRVAFGRYELIYGSVVLVALVLRVIDLKAKPFHHDESEHAWFTWLLVSGKGYHYDPVFHGPVQFYLMSLLYLLIGAGDLAARLAPALVGTLVTALPYLLRRQLGRPAALAAAVAICVSPSFLYFSRFVREDIYTACLTLAMTIAVFRFLDRPRRWHPAVILGLLATSFATKETTYITVFLGGVFFIGLAVWELRTGRGGREGALIRAVREVGRDAWVWGAASFTLTFTLLFSTFLTNPHGLQDGIVEGVRYWLSQQPVNRGDQPWFYYLVVLPAYEWPVLLFAAIGVVAVVRRPTALGVFLIWMFTANLVVFSWASERMPWLVLHIILAATLLAGLGAQSIWRARRTLWGKAGLAVGCACVLLAALSAITLAYIRPADPRELLVYTQTSNDVPKVATELIALSRTVSPRTHHSPTIEVDAWGGTGWPWSWYLRDRAVGYPDMSQPDFAPTADALVVADPNQPKLVGRLGDYVGRRFRGRVWWVPDWGGASLGDWARWIVLRRPWSPQGTLDEWLYVRRGLVSGRT